MPLLWVPQDELAFIHFSFFPHQSFFVKFPLFSASFLHTWLSLWVYYKFSFLLKHTSIKCYKQHWLSPTLSDSFTPQKQMIFWAFCVFTQQHEEHMYCSDGLQTCQSPSVTTDISGWGAIFDDGGKMILQLGRMLHTWNVSAWKAEAEKSGVRRQPEVCSQFEAIVVLICVYLFTQNRSIF